MKDRPDMLLAAALACALSTAGDASAQMTPSQAYEKQYNQNTYSRPYTYDNLARATVDTHFYHRPSVSPYLNLFRPSSSGAAMNYYNFVQPEQQRRDAVAQSQLNAQLQSFTPGGGGTLSSAVPSAGNVPRNRASRTARTTSSSTASSRPLSPRWATHRERIRSASAADLRDQHRGERTRRHGRRGKCLAKVARRLRLRV